MCLKRLRCTVISKKTIVIIAYNIIVLINRRYNTSLSIIATSTQMVFVDAKDFFHGKAHKKQAPIKIESWAHGYEQ